MTKKPGRGSDQFPLRLPDGMRDRIAIAAEQNGRSMNAEIIAMIGSSEAEVAEWKKRFETEREAFERMARLFEELNSLVEDYRNILFTTRAQSLQQLNSIENLADILTNLTEAPGPEVKEVAKVLKSSAELLRQDLERRFEAVKPAKEPTK